MTLFAYRLPRFFLNGWIDAKQFIDSIGDIDEGDEYLNSWREAIARRLDVASDLFTELGWEDGEILGAVWFAPLPVSNGSFAESEYMLAVETEQETFVASPFELPWLAKGALDSRRSEMLADPPSKTKN